MSINISFELDCVSTQEQELLKNYFAMQGLTCAASGHSLKIDGSKQTPHELTNKSQVVQAATEDWKLIAPLLKRDFSVKGSVISDLSEDYPFIELLIEYENKELSVHYTDCYDLCFMSEFEAYEDFCDKYGDDVFTKEEFEECCDDDFCVVDEGDGRFSFVYVDEAPFRYTL